MKSDPHSQRAVHAVMTLVLVIVKKQHISLVVCKHCSSTHKGCICVQQLQQSLASPMVLSEICAGLMSIKVLIMLAHCIM